MDCAIQAVEAVLSAPHDPAVRDARGLEVGQAIHQGDVYLHVVPADWPRGAERESRQLAAGESIGARHMVHGRLRVYEGVRLPSYVVPARGLRDGREWEIPASEYLGPVVVIEDGGGTHPEHAGYDVAPGTTLQVTYQCSPVTLRRVVD